MAHFYERPSSVQSKRVEKCSAKIDDLATLLNDSLSDADQLTANNARLRSDIGHLKPPNENDSDASLVGDVFTEGQATQDAEMTEAVVAALPKLRISTPVVAFSTLCINTP